MENLGGIHQGDNNNKRRRYPHRSIWFYRPMRRWFKSICAEPDKMEQLLVSYHVNSDAVTSGVDKSSARVTVVNAFNTIDKEDHAAVSSTEPWTRQLQR